MLAKMYYLACLTTHLASRSKIYLRQSAIVKYANWLIRRVKSLDYPCSIIARSNRCTGILFTSSYHWLEPPTYRIRSILSRNIKLRKIFLPRPNHLNLYRIRSISSKINSIYAFLQYTLMTKEPSLNSSINLLESI
jgi:hypothetical protein